MLDALPAVSLTAADVANEPECAICNEDFEVDNADISARVKSWQRQRTLEPFRWLQGQHIE